MLLCADCVHACCRGMAWLGAPRGSVHMFCRAMAWQTCQCAHVCLCVLQSDGLANGNARGAAADAKRAALEARSLGGCGRGLLYLQHPQAQGWALAKRSQAGCRVGSAPLLHFQTKSITTCPPWANCSSHRHHLCATPALSVCRLCVTSAPSGRYACMTWMPHEVAR